MKQRDENLYMTAITGIITMLTLLLYVYVYNHGTIYFSWEGFCVTGLYFAIDRFRGLYGFICAFIWFISMLAAREIMETKHAKRFYGSVLLTLFATLGIFYSDDLVLLYIFFEVMSLSSYIWVTHEQTENSKKVSDTYLLVSVLSGLVMLMGVIILWCNIGNLRFDAMKEIIQSGNISSAQLYIGGSCLLFGFGAKAGAFPMHFYLHTAYDTAPAPATAILSSALTKAGIFGVLVLTNYVFFSKTGWGMCLVIIGVITMLFNAIWGILQNNVFKILACSSVSQLGFILLGCGMINILQEERALAMQGTILYMVNHSLFKLILFLSCGVICKQADSKLLTKLRGEGRKCKALLIPVLTGCAGLAGIPLFSGYISKTLLHESIVEYIKLYDMKIMSGVEWLFLIAGGCTLAYVTKIFSVLFLQKPENSAGSKRMGNKLTIMSIWLPTILSLLCGIFPYVTMNIISKLEKNIYEMHEISYFSLENLKGSAISILIGCVIFFVIVRNILKKKFELPEWMNMEDNVYRHIFAGIIPKVLGMIAKILDGMTPVMQKWLNYGLKLIGIALDDFIPVIQKASDFILEKAAIFVSSITDFVILILQNSIFNSNKTIHLKKNEDAQILLREISQTNRIIQASLSFGFLMVCIGLCATLLYLLM